jgi:hypothetical protein
MEQLASVCGLAQLDPGMILHNLDVEIVRKEAKIAHLEPFLHLSLEFVDGTIVGAGDNQVIDIDPNNQPVTTPPPRVDAMFSTSLLESVLSSLAFQTLDA